MTKLAVAENNSTSDSKKVLSEQTNSKILKFVEEEGKRMVKGRFRNYESPGCAATITVKKYHEKYVPPFGMDMMDNETYEIPLYVARFLNGTDVTAKEVNCKINTCSKLVHSFGANSDGSLKPASGTDARGVPVPIFTGKYSRRYGFESLEFDQ